MHRHAHLATGDFKNKIVQASSNLACLIIKDPVFKLGKNKC